MRDTSGPLGEFVGLTLADSPQLNDPRYAVEAWDVIVESGKIEARPGRVEISEAQISISSILGGQVFFPVGSTTRKVVVVRNDGIYVRSE